VALSNTRRCEHLGRAARLDATMRKRVAGWAIWGVRVWYRIVLCCVEGGRERLMVGMLVVTSRQCDEAVGIWKAEGRNANG